jgi:hypothetical protein
MVGEDEISVGVEVVRGDGGLSGAWQASLASGWYVAVRAAPAGDEAAGNQVTFVMSNEPLTAGGLLFVP